MVGAKNQLNNRSMNSLNKSLFRRKNQPEYENPLMLHKSPTHRLSNLLTHRCKRKLFWRKNQPHHEKPLINRYTNRRKDTAPKCLEAIWGRIRSERPRLPRGSSPHHRRRLARNNKKEFKHALQTYTGVT